MVRFYNLFNRVTHKLTDITNQVRVRRINRSNNYTFPNEDRPSSSPFLSIDTFRAECDVLVEQVPFNRDFPSKAHGIIKVFCVSELLEYFFHELAGKIEHPFILYSGNSDRNIKSMSFDPLPDGMLSWYAQNLEDNNNPRVFPLPIGLENLHYKNHGNIQDFDILRNNRVKKEIKILYGFNIETNPQERANAFDSIRTHPLSVGLVLRLPSLLYRRELIKYAFVLSPPGNGIDCHRTWEAMYLRTIPIVKKSYMTSFYKEKGLPLILVNNWDEVIEMDQSFLAMTYEKLSRNFDCKFLFSNAWMNN